MRVDVAVGVGVSTVVAVMVGVVVTTGSGPSPQATNGRVAAKMARMIMSFTVHLRANLGSAGPNGRYSVGSEPDDIFRLR